MATSFNMIYTSDNSEICEVRVFLCKYSIECQSFVKESKVGNYFI